MVTSFKKAYLFVRYTDHSQEEIVDVAEERDKQYNFSFKRNIDQEIADIWIKFVIDSPSQVHMMQADNDGENVTFINVLHYDYDMYLSKEVIFHWEKAEYVKKIALNVKIWINEEIDFNVYETYITKCFHSIQGEKDANWQHKIDTVLGELQKKNAELQGQNEKLSNEIQNVENELYQKDRKLEEYERTLVNKNGHIEQLLQKERDYVNLMNTKGVRALRVWWNFKEKLLPQGSKRRLWAKFAKKFLRHPIYMLKKCTPSRIRRTLHYMRTEDVNSISNRLDAATLNAGGDIERIKLDLYPVVGDITNKDDIEKLVLPHIEKPEVSIIIPVYNQFHYTYNCIKSIIDHTENVTYEVILADDCSTDVTKDIDQIVENIVIARTPENMRFLRNCNNAAKQARGKYIFFLNNDTQVQENWLSTLVDLMESDEKIGMCGSMLLYPDGALQEAGGIVWKDASAWNFGHLHGPMVQNLIM